MPVPGVLWEVGGYGAAIGAAVAVTLVKLYLDGRRRTALSRAARGLGLRFSAQAHLANEGFIRSPLFRQDGQCRFSNVLRGTPQGTQGVTIFDHSYETGGGRSRATHHQTAAVLRYPKGLPEFSLRPESLLHKMKELFAHRDIEFPEHPGFGQRYRLSGLDEAALRGLFRLNLLEYFEAHPGWSLDAGRAWLVACRQGQLVKPQAMGEFLDELRLLLWAFPR